jgi:hypothetical protein
MARRGKPDNFDHMTQRPSFHGISPFRSGARSGAGAAQGDWLVGLVTTMTTIEGDRERRVSARLRAEMAEQLSRSSLWHKELEFSGMPRVTALLRLHSAFTHPL